MKKYISIIILIVFVCIGIVFYDSNEKKSLDVQQASNSGTQITTPTADKDKSNIPSIVSSSQISPNATEESLRINMPNTLWQTKVQQINGKNVTYVFGQGQPAQFALSREKVEEYMQTSNGELGAPHGYVTPKAEYALKNFLENQGLPYFLEKCYNNVSWGKSDNIFGKPYPSDFNIETLMYINSSNGLKEFRYEDIEMILSYFNHLDNPLAATEEKLWKQCLSQTEYTQHFMSLHDSLSNVYRVYSTPLENLN